MIVETQNDNEGDGIGRLQTPYDGMGSDHQVLGDARQARFGSVKNDSAESILIFLES